MVVGSKECEGSRFGVGIGDLEWDLERRRFLCNGERTVATAKLNDNGWSRRRFGMAMVYLQWLSSTAAAEALSLSLIATAELKGDGGWSRRRFGV